MKKFSLMLLSLVSCYMMTMAQAPNEFLAAADKYFASGDYYSAAQYYEKFLAGKKPRNAGGGFNPYYVSAVANKKLVITSNSKEKVIYNLAECYRKLHYPEKAVPYYEQAVNFDKNAFPLARFHYAGTLRSLGRYDSAATEYAAFRDQYTEKDQYAATADLEVKNISFIKTQMNRKTLSAYKIEKNAGLNAEGGSYAPVWVNEKTIWFTSTRPFGDDKTRTNRVYEAPMNDGKAGTVSQVTLNQPKDQQQGVVSLSPDGNTLYLTRWNIQSAKKNADIYVSRKTKDAWSDPALVNALHVEGSNTQQPFVMPDGKTIVFSSDRPGGQGGLDLWMATIDENGNIGAPINMGPNVNSVLDEQAPSYHAPSQTFVFSSNGRVGMGGYDFYYCKGGNIFNLSAPKNFGYPVNSSKDDLYFTSRGPARNILEDVILSSDREASCCLELFSLSKPKPIKNISGIVYDCESKKPLSDVKVMIKDTINNKIVTELTTDASGKYAFTMEEYQPLKAVASDSGYFNNSITFNGPDDEEESSFSSPDLCLTLIPTKPEETVTVENIYYDFNKATLKKESFASLDKLVILLNENPTLQIELNSHTDSKGNDNYNLKLSDARAKSVVKYLIKKGIDKKRLTWKGLGETMPVADNTNPDGTDNPEGRAQNRRTEFKVTKL